MDDFQVSDTCLGFPAQLRSYPSYSPGTLYFQSIQKSSASPSGFLASVKPLSISLSARNMASFVRPRHHVCSVGSSSCVFPKSGLFPSYSLSPLEFRRQLPQLGSLQDLLAHICSSSQVFLPYCTHEELSKIPVMSCLTSCWFSAYSCTLSIDLFLVPGMFHELSYICTFTNDRGSLCYQPCHLFVCLNPANPLCLNLDVVLGKPSLAH